MRPEIVSLLRCPSCGEGLEQKDRCLVCPNRHTFDLAHQGYVSLLTGRAGGIQGDSAQMVAAREAFLVAGHFAGLRAAVAARAATCLGFGAARAGGDGGATGVGRRGGPGMPGAPGLPARPGGANRPRAILEVGAGTGYYLAGVLNRAPGAVGLALDLSKPALRRAARAHERLGAAAGDIWDALPVRSGSIDLILDVFAPRNAAEFRRVLRPEGCLEVVTPSERHLQELVGPLGLLAVDPEKQQRIDRAFADLFGQADGEPYQEMLRLSHDDVAALVEMGPSARHLSEAELKGRLQALPPVVAVTLSVEIALYRLV